jgi:ribosome-binding protein aMBF1 (putative translation factor)
MQHSLLRDAIIVLSSCRDRVSQFGALAPLHRPEMAGFSRRKVTMTVSISNIKACAGNEVVAGQIARAVVEARLAAGYSIDDLAVTTGLVHAEITRVEDGSDADPAKVKRIAAALKMPPSAFLVA